MPDGRQIVRKLKMPTIVFKVETRSGNKKVTLVNNLAAFGLDPKEIAHTTQVGVAASATLGDAACCEGFQVTVQGNQVNYIGDLLMRTYGIDRKYIEGLDLAPKKKK
ncbi:unnamed protein product, partial [Mesorhabditis belari]|uniref:SUI1 domain-containing protein n=1 Tax=Mesorhabditis belari TaxID=2138241 RepID=A0AAF3FGL5_9BILA